MQECRKSLMQPQHRRVLLFTGLRFDGGIVSVFQITKILQKKKNATTYTFKQSLPLHGMNVLVFETACE